jgi:hypothetical protein
MRHAATLAWAVALAGVAACFACDESSWPGAPRKPLEAERARSVVTLEGITFTDHCDGAHSRVAIAGMEARDRKLGFFAMRGVTQIELRGVRGTVGACANAAAEAPSAEASSVERALRQPARDLGIGFVTRVVARDVDLVVEEIGAAPWRVRAGRIDLGTGAGGVRLAGGFEVAGPDGSVLRGTQARWDTRADTLAVAGSHEWTDSSGRRRGGQGGRFEIDRSRGVRPD